MLWRLASGFASSADREDLLQEIMLQIWIALPRFEQRSKLSTWAYRVGLLTAFNWKRKSQRKPMEAELDETLLASQSQGSSPSPAESLEIIYTGLRKLKVLDRSILLLALEETPRKEISEILGISENATHVRLHRARAHLTEVLEEELQ